jgi:methyltransferase (TIGR00027 family)
MKLFIYALLMVMLLPVFLLGFPFYMVPILLSRKKVSGTTYEPFNGRLLYHLSDSRPDTAALQLAGWLPATNRVFMGLLVRPIIWASRISGYKPVFLEYPPPRPTPMSAMVGARCEFLDKAMIDHVSTGDQVVILGAGWDTRAYGLLKGQNVMIFEVDAPATQAVKLAAIDKAGLDASHVTFVSCDFNRQSWLEALQNNSFNPAKRTFILWEGVTMYLEEHAIQSTFRAVSTLPAGSRIAFDFLSREWLEETRAGKTARLGVKATYGEPFTFGFPVTPDFSGQLANYLEEHGLALDRDRPMGGDKEDGIVPYGGLVLAVTTTLP